jgi:hypothetical protein
VAETPLVFRMAPPILVVEQGMEGHRDPAVATAMAAMALKALEILGEEDCLQTVLPEHTLQRRDWPL